MKILLVEDEAFMLEALSNVIERTGIEVIRTDNIKSAMEVLQSNQINILITDLYLPKPDGYELINYVKSNPEFAHMHVIAITGYDDEIMYDITGVHPDIFLKKPFELEDLHRSIRKIMLEEAS